MFDLTKDDVVRAGQHPAHFEEDFILALENFIESYKSKKHVADDLFLPISIFSDKKLGILEACAKYLKENLSLNYAKIGRVLNRNERTIWVSFHSASKKKPEKFSPKKQEIYVPCNIFRERKLGPLEVIVIYLKNARNMPLADIAKSLNRSYGVVWLSYKNGMKKENEQKKR